MNIKIETLMDDSGVHFGTSGVRGLVSDMTDQVCFSYVSAFLQYMAQQSLLLPGGQVGIAGDLRKSTPRIINAAVTACREMGFVPVYYGLIPSPAIALHGISQSMPTIMVTGSHIPDDRNGIKFNTPRGEILKQDEAEIRQQCVDVDATLFDDSGYLSAPAQISAAAPAAYQYYVERYTAFFPRHCLKGKHIGLYEHSSVAREVFKTILQELGAKVTSLGRSEAFISVDTEAIRPEDIELASRWAQSQRFDCIVSADGDGDRPLISDEHGQWLRGDIVGILCAAYLKADTVVTPVSCNSAVEKSQLFKRVIRTRIGSPFVITAMQEAQQAAASAEVVGYEANGGFLQQTQVTRDGKTLSPLPTRDAMIVVLSVMMAAFEKNLTLSGLVKTLPERYTYSDRLKSFPTALSQHKLAEFSSGDWPQDRDNIQKAFPFISRPVSVDVTDGVRISLENEDVIHMRPSGNAPELRCYTESGTSEAAKRLNQDCIRQMASWNL